MALTKIRQGPLSHWSPEVKQMLYRLTIREESGMVKWLQDIERWGDGAVDYKIFALFEDERVVAWSIAAFDQRNDEYDLHVYTRHDRRRLGYGRRLFDRAKKWVKSRDGEYLFFPEPSNADFFGAVDPDSDLMK